MLRHGVTQAFKPQCRYFARRELGSLVAKLPDATLETFQTRAFNPATPALLPGQFTHLPAITKWFSTDHNGDVASINHNYLDKFGSTIVPLEITHKGQFARIEQPLSFFLDVAASNNPDIQVYLAQASLSDLPFAEDVPVPEIVVKAGRGDIYSSSIWLGRAPTYTPLHSDPNPNLFLQLAGSKLVKMYKPRVGLSIYNTVQERIGGVGKATMRGEEMMQGAERQALEDEVWNRDGGQDSECWEAEVGSGDGLFIPQGWWHSIRSSHGEGMTGSANFWFR